MSQPYLRPDGALIFESIREAVDHVCRERERHLLAVEEAARGVSVARRVGGEDLEIALDELDAALGFQPEHRVLVRGAMESNLIGVTRGGEQ